MIIEKLNFLLADELTAISQYMVHSEMSANWGYEKLHKHFEKRAVDEKRLELLELKQAQLNAARRTDPATATRVRDTGAALARA